jgi:hypothetical protein
VGIEVKVTATGNYTITDDDLEREYKATNPQDAVAEDQEFIDRALSDGDSLGLLLHEYDVLSHNVSCVLELAGVNGDDDGPETAPV